MGLLGKCVFFQSAPLVFRFKTGQNSVSSQLVGIRRKDYSVELWWTLVRRPEFKFKYST